MKYLKTLGYKVVTGRILDGKKVDYFLPEINAAFIVGLQDGYNFDSITEKAKLLMNRRVLEASDSKYKVYILNSLRFRDLYTDEDKL